MQAKPVGGVGVPPLDLKSLVAAADEILVGSASQVRKLEDSTLTVNGMVIPVKILEAELAVELIIKGRPENKIRVTFIMPETFIGYHGIPVASHRIFLLKRRDSKLEPVSPYYPSLPAADTVEPGVEHMNAFEQVVMHVAAVFYAPAGDLSDREEALWLLHFVDSPIRLTAFQTASSQDPDLSIRLNAMAELLAAGDSSVLPAVKQVLLNPNPQGIPSWRLDEAQQNLSSALARVKDPQVIPTLTEILKSPDVRVRRAAVSALRNTQSDKALDALLNALHDRDFEVRYWAVVGLAEIMGENEWRPLQEAFRSDEPRYIQHWESVLPNH